MSFPSVACIVLSYQGKQLVPQTLDSLFALDYPNFRVIVVDNGSSDGTFEAVAAAWPQVTPAPGGAEPRHLGRPQPGHPRGARRRRRLPAAAQQRHRGAGRHAARAGGGGRSPTPRSARSAPRPTTTPTATACGRPAAGTYPAVDHRRARKPRARRRAIRTNRRGRLRERLRHAGAAPGAARRRPVGRHLPRVGGGRRLVHAGQEKGLALLLRAPRGALAHGVADDRRLQAGPHLPRPAAAPCFSCANTPACCSGRALFFFLLAVPAAFLRELRTGNQAAAVAKLRGAWAGWKTLAMAGGGARRPAGRWS